MKKYFKHELKNNAILIASLTVILTVIYTTYVLSSAYPSSVGINLWGMSLLGGIIAAIVPPILFVYKMQKRSLDLYYALPLSHTKIFAVKYLIGLIAVFLPYTAAYFTGALGVMMKLESAINAVFYIPHYFSTLLPLYIIYSICVFLFTRAHTLMDGIMTMLLGFFAIPLAALIFTDKFGNYFFAYCLLPFAPLDNITTGFQYLIAPPGNGYHPFNDYGTVEIMCLSIGFGVNAACSVLSTVFAFKLEKSAKAEDAGQISDSFFSYKAMLPLYLFCLTALTHGVLDQRDIVIYFAIYGVGFYLLAVLYKRSLKIGVKTTASLAAAFAAGLILAIIFHFL